MKSNEIMNVFQLELLLPTWSVICDLISNVQFCVLDCVEEDFAL